MRQTHPDPVVGQFYPNEETGFFVVSGPYKKGKNICYDIACKCGTVRPKQKGALKRGKGSCMSCAKKALKVTAGDVYGYLKVLEEQEKDAHGDRWVLVDCTHPYHRGEPKRHRITIGNLQHTQTCGCAKKAGKQGSAWRKRLRSLKSQFKRKRGSDSFSDEYLYSLCSSPCQACGRPPHIEWRAASETFLSNSIDRIDNYLPYIKGNVQTLCDTCNMLKSTFEFRRHTTNLTCAEIQEKLRTEVERYRREPKTALDISPTEQAD